MKAYQGGHRVPCFIRWPEGGVKEGVEVDRLTGHIDLFKTFMEITQAPETEVLEKQLE